MILKIIYVVILLCLIFSIQSRKKQIKVERFGASNESVWRRSSIYEDREENLKLEAADAMKKMWENGIANTNSNGYLDQKEDCGPRHSEKQDTKCAQCLLEDCTTNGPAGVEAGGRTRARRLIDYWGIRKKELSDSMYGIGGVSCPTAGAAPESLCGQKEQTQADLLDKTLELAEYVDLTATPPTPTGAYKVAVDNQDLARTKLDNLEIEAWGTNGDGTRGVIDNFGNNNDGLGNKYLEAVEEKIQAVKNYNGYDQVDSSTGKVIVRKGTQQKLQELEGRRLELGSIIQDKTDAIQALEDVIRCHMGYLTTEDLTDFVTNENVTIPSLSAVYGDGGQAFCSHMAVAGEDDSGSGNNNNNNSLGDEISQSWNHMTGAVEDGLRHTARGIGRGLNKGAQEMAGIVKEGGQYVSKIIDNVIDDPKQFAQDIIDATPYGEIANIAEDGIDTILDAIIDIGDEITHQQMKETENKKKLRKALKRCEKENCKESCRNQFSGLQKDYCIKKCDDFWETNPTGPLNCGLFTEDQDWTFN